MCTNVLDCISIAVEDNIPINVGTDSNAIPGWSDFVKPYKDSSMFWHAVWVSAGRPIDTELHKLMKHTRNQYHYAIRKVKNHEKEIRKNKFLNACLDGKVSDILKDIKISRNKNNKSSGVIDGFTNNTDIADNFKNIYSNIYNTHNDYEDLSQFSVDNNAKIGQSDIDIVLTVLLPTW